MAKNVINRKNNNHKKNHLISNVSNQRLNKNQVREKLNDGILVYSDSLTVTELAEKIGISPGEVVKCLFKEILMVNVNTTLTDDLIVLVCLNFGDEVN